MAPPQLSSVSDMMADAVAAGRRPQPPFDACQLSASDVMAAPRAGLSRQLDDAAAGGGNVTVGGTREAAAAAALSLGGAGEAV